VAGSKKKKKKKKKPPTLSLLTHSFARTWSNASKRSGLVVSLEEQRTSRKGKKQAKEINVKERKRDNRNAKGLK